MHEPVGPAFLVYLETSGLATLMRQSLWLYPIVEIAHILGFVTLVGSVAMFDLRLLGFSRSLPVSRAGAAPVALVAGEPAARRAIRPHDVLGACHRIRGQHGVSREDAAARQPPRPMRSWFHRTSFRSVADWNTGVPPPLASRVAAGVSLALWIGVISCGRLIAYL